ncbi:putative ras-2 protein [Echria macrotheca]|uniref:Ras-2 protein n=1 Tax=Echria macrotheca TaxID=438768 RepID=A0AAJ0B7U0_9PEZI|nr:putative ras-2 protein [Echria macrotheca]
MADPLSIAASVVGLVSVAGKISTVITSFVLGVADVPESARAALAAVDAMRLTLASVRQLMTKLSEMPRQRKEMIHVTHLVVIFREAILSFSELEGIICPASASVGETTGAWDAVKWLLQEKRITAAVQRLESHRTSLSAVLNILQCQSQIEAQESLSSLQKTVQELVDRNENLLRRLEQYHCSYAENASVRFFDDGESVLPRQEPPAEIPGSSSNERAIGSSEDSGSPRDAMSPRDFEITLEQTRVYARVQSNDCDISFTSSEVRTTAWSMLSGLSLNDISIISVLALPISLDEVESFGSQVTFVRIISGAQEPKSSNSQDLQLPSSSAVHQVSLPPIAEERSEQQTQVETTPSRLPVSTSPIQSQLRVHKDPHVVKAGKMEHYKLVVLGDGGSGKTDLTIQLCLNHFVSSYDPTIEDSYRKQAVIDGDPCMLEILDTAGQEEYTALRDQWIRDGEGFLIVYSVTSRSSFSRCMRFYRQVQRIKETASYTGQAIPIMLVGNNSDRVTERDVLTQEGHAMAREMGVPFVETSARHCVNVEKAFYDVVRIIRGQRWWEEQRLRRRPLPPRTKRWRTLI